MTLESVVVDCENAKIPGMIGVALGRSKTAENLQVKHFKHQLITEHPAKVNEFYCTTSKNVCPELTCCKNEFISLELENELYSPFDIDTENPESGIDFDNDGDDDDDRSVGNVDKTIDARQKNADPGVGTSGPVSKLTTQNPLPTPDYIEHSYFKFSC